MIQDQMFANVHKKMEKVAETQKNVKEVLSQTEKNVESGLGIDLNLAEMTFAEAKEQETAMNNNIAELINALDNVTNQIGEDFSTMREKTISEKVVGFFSANKSEAMRNTRISSSDVGTKLQEIITQSNTITEMLKKQSEELKIEHADVKNNLEILMNNHIKTAESLTNIRKEISDLEPQLMNITKKISETTDIEVRSQLEKEKQNMITKNNELVNQEKEVLSKSQEEERYISMNKEFVESLQNQISAQEVLINKIQFDTDQRVLLYDATEKSIKTSNQQDIAHKINSIGTKTDTEVTKMVAGIGAAANNHLVQMLEEHGDLMEKQKQIGEAKQLADEQFNRRFAEVIKKHNIGNYGA